MSFETLREIARENREEAERAASRPPVACPLDGTPLQVRGEVRNCPMGNYRWEPGLGGRELDGPGVESGTFGGW